MASTIQLQRTIEIASRYIYQAPLLFMNDGSLAFSIGDYVRQFMLSPPFAWRWNRGVIPPILCQTGLTDYSINVPDFGWIEKAWIVFPTNPGDPPKVIELSVLNNLAQENVQNQSGWISSVYDDNNGNVTFRVMPPPDQAYTLYINYQKSSKTFSKTSDLWTPIPDYMSYLYNQGFLAKVYEYKDDERFAFVWNQFLKQVIAANDGLTDTQKNIFLEPRVLTMREQQGYIQGSQLAKQGKIS